MLLVGLTYLSSKLNTRLRISKNVHLDVFHVSCPCSSSFECLFFCSSHSVDVLFGCFNLKMRTASSLKCSFILSWPCANAFFTCVMQAIYHSHFTRTDTETDKTNKTKTNKNVIIFYINISYFCVNKVSNVQWPRCCDVGYIYIYIFISHLHTGKWWVMLKTKQERTFHT